MKRIIPLIILLFYLSPFPSKANNPSPLIRVKILEEETLNIDVDGPCQIKGENNNLLAYRSSFNSGKIEATARGIVVKQILWGNRVRISSNSLIEVNGRRYRGDILLIQKSPFLEVVNELPLEEYLYGVIRGEIDSTWEEAAVMSQAIAARNYALKKIRDNPEEDYHLSNTESDQIYRGYEAEDLLAKSAVDKTCGEVITYNDELAEVYYHNCSGGYTASSKDVWGRELSYLVAKPDEFSTDNPYYEWEYPIKVKDLEEILRKNGVSTGEIYDIKVLSRDESGRVKELKIKYNGAKEPLKLKGKDFRRLVGYNKDKIASTLFWVKREGKFFVFTGKGHGHGVGMSQWGAKKMAEQGYSYKEILEFYYPGTQIKNIY